MDYSVVLTLYCFDRFQGERSLNAPFYLLKGKKSSQTIQDAAWYALRNVFQSLPDLSFAEYNGIVKQLAQMDYIQINGGQVAITHLGKAAIENELQTRPIPSFLNGWKYHDIEKTFWQRLNLLIQTVSYWSKSESRFFPVQRNLVVQQWVKLWLQKKRMELDKTAIAQDLHKELYHLFSQLQSKRIDPSAVVFRSSGYRITGLTNRQIAEKYSVDEVYSVILFRAILHYMISTIWNEKNNYPLLFSLLEDKKFHLNLTNSARITYRLLMAGKKPDEIVKYRNLKKSTIEDHIVEIALKVPSFDLESYVDRELQQKLIETINAIPTRKLKAIKDRVPEADYFTIRLVLSSMSNVEDNEIPDFQHQSSAGS